MCKLLSSENAKVIVNTTENYNLLCHCVFTIKCLKCESVGQSALCRRDAIG